MLEESYELVFLSDLRRKSRSGQNTHDFQMVINYIFTRIENITDNTSSEFNRMIKIIEKIIPKSLLLIILNRFRYDSIIGFKTKNGEKKIYCMVSFQKHPLRQMIGMFDFYITPEERNKDIARQFLTMSEMMDEMRKRYKKNGFDYIQCGINDTTRRALRIFRRICKKHYPQLSIDIEASRIFLE